MTTAAPNVPFAKLSELPVGESVIMMGYGAAGSGKTEFLGTGGSKTLIIDTGYGMETLKAKHGFKSRHPNSDPTIVSIWEKVKGRGKIDSATAFDTICDVIDYTLDHHASDIDIVAIDDVTALRRFAMNKALEVGQKSQRSFAKANEDKFGAIVIGVQDFGIEMELVQKFVSTYTSIFRGFKKHFVMMAHERLTLIQPRDDKGKPIIGGESVLKDTRPGFTGKTFPDDIVVYFDEVWHFEPVGSGDVIVYRARTSGGEDITGKTRHGGIFPTIIKNPNLLKAINCIKTDTPYKD